MHDNIVRRYAIARNKQQSLIVNLKELTDLTRGQLWKLALLVD